MKKSVLPTILFALAWVSFAGGAVIQNPPVSIISVGLDPCHQHPGHHCLVELNPEPATLLPAGGSAFLNAVMAAQYPAWTVANGGAINVTFDITQYDAYNDCNPGGAEININYVPGAGAPADVIWAQAIFTNQRRGGPAGVWASYMDVIAGNPNVWPPPAYPYQYVDNSFYDKPGRPCPAGGFIAWDGEAYATSIDYATSTLTVYEGVEWGFLYFCWVETALNAMPTMGSTSTSLMYDPTTQNLSILTSPINIMNLTGGNELSPIFASDPLQSCTIAIENLRWAGPQQGGGYLFTDGVLTIRAPDHSIVLAAELAGVLVDDNMEPEGGFNIAGIYGNFSQEPPFGSQMLQMYLSHLAQNEIPQFVISTNGPFSELLGDGTQFVSASGTLKQGFAVPQPSWYPKGDLNGDGLVNGADISPFIEFLTNPALYAINHPDVPAHDTADINGDGVVDEFDIPGFVQLLLGQ